MPLEMMVRVCFLQNWSALNHPVTEEMLYSSAMMGRSLGIELD